MAWAREVFRADTIPSLRITSSTNVLQQRASRPHSDAHVAVGPEDTFGNSPIQILAGPSVREPLTFRNVGKRLDTDVLKGEKTRNVVSHVYVDRTHGSTISVPPSSCGRQRAKHNYCTHCQVPGRRIMVNHHPGNHRSNYPYHRWEQERKQCLLPQPLDVHERVVGSCHPL